MVLRLVLFRTICCGMYLVCVCFTDFFKQSLTECYAIWFFRYYERKVHLASKNLLFWFFATFFATCTPQYNILQHDTRQHQTTRVFFAHVFCTIPGAMTHNSTTRDATSLKLVMSRSSVRIGSVAPKVLRIIARFCEIRGTFLLIKRYPQFFVTLFATFSNGLHRVFAR